MRIQIRTGFAFFVGFLAIAADGASAQRLFGPDAAEILGKTLAALRRVDRIAYEAGYNLEGEHPELLPGAEGKVILRPGDPKGHTRAWVDGQFWYPKVESPRHLTFATDGSIAYQIQYDTKYYYKGSYNLLDELLYPGDTLVLDAFGSEAPFGYDIDPAAAVYQGEVEIGEVSCHILQLFHERLGGETMVYVGKDDFLPRRLDRTFKLGDRTFTRSLTLFDLDTSPDIAPDQFHLKAPEGFTEEEYLGKPKLLEVGATAPDWTIKAARGGKVSLADHRGKVVVIDFWATWCGPCKRAMPSVQKLHEKFQGEPVVVYGVSSFETDGDPAAYMKEKGYTYPLLVEGDQAAEDYHVTGIPTFYVIGPKGDIVFCRQGYNEGEEKDLIAIIESVLAEYERDRG